MEYSPAGAALGERPDPQRVCVNQPRPGVGACDEGTARSGSSLPSGAAPRGSWRCAVGRSGPRGARPAPVGETPRSDRPGTPRWPREGLPRVRPRAAAGLQAQAGHRHRDPVRTEQGHGVAPGRLETGQQDGDHGRPRASPTALEPVPATARPQGAPTAAVPGRARHPPREPRHTVRRRRCAGSVPGRTRVQSSVRA